MKYLSLLAVLSLGLSACAGPQTPAAPAGRTFNLGDTIVTSGAACDQAFQCILGKRPEYQEMYDTLKMFSDETQRVQACNNALVNPLEFVPECAP